MIKKINIKIVSIIMLVCMISCLFYIPANAASGVINGTKYERSFDPANNGVPIEFDKKQKVTFKHSGTIKLPDMIPEKEVLMLIDTSGSLYQQQKGVINPFDYCLYSGNPDPETYLLFQGTNISIEGLVHSNSGIKLQANTINYSYKDKDGNTVNSGICEYVTGVDSKAYSNYDAIKNSFVQAEITELPDIKGKLDTFAETYLNGTFMFTPDNYDTTLKAYIALLKEKGLNLDLHISCAKGADGNTYVFSVGGGSSFLVLPGVKLDFKGSVKFTNGIRFNEYGIVCAENDIELGGNEIFTSANNEAFFYSVNGSITNITSMSNFTGTMYAPKGEVRLTGDHINIVGSVLAKDIKMDPQSTKITYDSNSKIQEILSKVFPAPTYYNAVFDQVNTFLERIKEDIENKKYAAPVKIGILTYDSTANDGNYTNNRFYDSGVPKFIDINNSGAINNLELTELENAILDIGTNVVNVFEEAKKVEKFEDLDPRIGKSNLGDGLRRAKRFFSDRTDVSKTVIVFAGSAPNTWTSTWNGSADYIGDGDVGTGGSKFIKVDNIKPDNATGNGTKFTDSNPYKYADRFIKDLVNAGVVPIFLNYLPNDEENKSAYPLNDFAFKKLESNVKIINPSLKDTQLYYDVQENGTDFNNIIKTIDDSITRIMEADKPPIKTKLVMTCTIPKDAKYIDRFPVSVQSNDYTSITNSHKFKYVVENYELTYDKNKGEYILPATEFSILVKYILKNPIPKNAKGQVLIEMPYEVKLDSITKMPNDVDNMASFEVEYYETGKATKTRSVINSYLNPDKVPVIYMTDIT